MLYLCAVAEKMTSPFELRVHGRSGHASMPGIADNALVKAAALHRAAREASTRSRGSIPETEGFLAAVSGLVVPGAADALEAAGPVDPLAAELLEPLLAATVAPTMVHASEKRNVIPALCTVGIDCRLLPGQSTGGGRARDPRAARPGRLRAGRTSRRRAARARAATGRSGTPSSRSSQPRSRGRGSAPMCVAGFTDSHWLREAFGTIAYGFFPARAMDPELAARLIHSADERVPVSDLELGVRWLQHAARAVCG